MLNGNTEYEYYERKSKSRYNRRCIDGKITGCGNCVGYCKYCEHPGFLTLKLQKEHDCLGKECAHFLPKEKARKRIAINDKKPELLLKYAQSCVEDSDDLRILNSSREGDGWVLGYVSVFGYSNLSKIEETIRINFGVPVKMRRLNYSFDRCVELLLKN